MKTLIIVLVSGLLAEALYAQASPDIGEFQRLETVWNRAHVTGDSAALQTLWSDDLEVTVPRMPVMSKADVLAFAKSGRMLFERYETSELKIRAYGDVVVVTGRLLRTRTVNGKKTDDDWRFTKVYVRQNRQWRVVTFHASEAAPS